MLLRQGAELMVYGMGTVVVFLTLLVFATRLLSAAVARYFPEPEVPEAAAQRQPRAADPSPDVVAAISAALHVHRGRAR